MKQISLSELDSEDKIISRWQANESLVSISCITYNHALYIEDALIGFLRQKTTFPFEILVRDDASTDGTKDIIEKYRLLYPKIINAKYEPENTRSRGVRPLPTNCQRARGEYIAVCEGDDYWIDDYKLSDQINALQRNPNANICFTPAYSGRDSSNTKLMCRHFDYEIIIEPKKVISSDGGFMPTASLMFRTKVLTDVLQAFEVLGKYKVPGDYILQVVCSLKGGAVFSPKPSCFYREAAKGSWSLRQTKRTSEEITKNTEDIKDFYQLFDGYVGSRELSNSFKVALSKRLVNQAKSLIIIGDISNSSKLFSEVKIKYLKRNIDKLVVSLGSFRFSSLIFHYLHKLKHIVKKKYKTIGKFGKGN